MNFVEIFFKQKYYIYIIFICILMICGFTIISKATYQKYSKPVEVKKYNVSKLEEENKQDDIIFIENVETDFVISDNKEEEEKEENDDEEIKKEDGNVTYKGVTVEIPEVVVAKVNDKEDKEKQNTDTSTANASSVSIEESLELFENSGNSLGIDVSKWQGDINWAEVKNSGVEFAMIRIGYRGSSQGSIVMDPYFTKNITGATSNGIKVGVYFFSMAVDETEAIQEAAWTVENARKYKITYPIAYDFESWGVGRVAGVSNEQIEKNALAFLGYIRSSGYSAMMYGSKNALSNKFSMGNFSNYKVWLAHYTEQTNYAGRYNMWQYTSKGSVPGISGEVDMNIAYFSYSNEKEALAPELVENGDLNVQGTDNEGNTKIDDTSIKSDENEVTEKQDTEKDTATKQDTEKDTATKQDTEKDTATKQDTEKDTATKQDTEKDTATKQDTEKDTAPKQDAEKDTAPKQDAEKDTATKSDDEKNTTVKPEQDTAAKTESSNTDESENINNSNSNIESKSVENESEVNNISETE